jgi:DNA mismatch repair ATPase MutS
MLRTELAFYVACLNLRRLLIELQEPTCFPVAAPAGERKLSFSGVYDACLALSAGRKVVGNDLDADGKDLIVITGANTGGKSTFMRSLGLAQLMMQAGMFVPAETFAAEVRDGVFTHYKREEDVTMESGKLDEELGRMSDIVDKITPNSMALFNESFAATNEREGSEIARQITNALVESGVKVCFVTHLYEFAHSILSGGTAGRRNANVPSGRSRTLANQLRERSVRQRVRSRAFASRRAKTSFDDRPWWVVEMQIATALT